MQLSDAIAESHGFSELLYKRRFSQYLRVRASAACFSVSQQHYHSILVLLSQATPLEATSHALLRPLLESVFRGLWLRHVATDAQIEEYVKSGSKLNMADLIREVDKKIEMNAYEGMYRKTWSALSAYTHTGEFQVQRWLVSEHIEPTYTKEAIAELLDWASFAARLAFDTMMEMSSEAPASPP